VKVLFVCSGNTCRSSYAEAAARSLGLEARSAGTMAMVGMPAAPDAVAASARRGFDLEGHRATALDAALVSWADVVVAFGERHVQAIEQLGGATKTRLVLVEDPWERGADAYDQAYDQIDAAVRSLE
jgi:protein-tyrosine phosphatase